MSRLSTLAFLLVLAPSDIVGWSQPPSLLKANALSRLHTNPPLRPALTHPKQRTSHLCDQYQVEIAPYSQSLADITKITSLGAATNVLLALIKVVAATAANSQALMADAVHSLSDLISDGWTILIMQLGHGPLAEYSRGCETVGCLGIAGMLLTAGVGLCLTSGSLLLQPVARCTPTGAGLIMASSAVSVGAKEWLYRATMRVGRRAGSPTVMANAQHHRSDAFSSGATLVSGAGSAAGLFRMDALGGVVVGLMVAHMGAEIAMENVGKAKEMCGEGWRCVKEWGRQRCSQLEHVRVMVH